MPQIYNTHFLVNAPTLQSVQQSILEALHTFPWFTAAWHTTKQKHGALKYTVHVLNENHDDIAFKIHILPENDTWWINLSITRRSPTVAMYWRVFLDVYNRIGSCLQTILPDTHPDYTPRYMYERHILPLPYSAEQQSAEQSAEQKADIVHFNAHIITNDYFPMLFSTLRTYALLQLARAHISPVDADESGLFPVAQACVWSGTVSWVHLYALWKLAPEKQKERAFENLLHASNLLCQTCKDKGFTTFSKAQPHTTFAQFDSSICVACYTVINL